MKRFAAVGIALLAAMLAFAEEAPSIDKLIEQLSARENTVRREAALQLSKLGPAAKPAVPALITAIADPDKQVWENALGALASLGPDAIDALPALLDNFDTRKGRGRDRDRRQSLMRSAFAISRMGPPAIPALIEALKNEDPGMRAGAVKALGGMGPAARESVPALIPHLSRFPSDYRADLIDSLALIGAPALPALAEALASKEAKVRAGAALAIAQIGRGAQSLSTQVADATARETDPDARAALLAAVAKVGLEPKRAVELLMTGVKDDNEQVRHGAINAIYLLRSANDRLIPALVALLRDPNPVQGERAAVVLGRLGPAASTAVPALLEVARKRTPTPPVFFDALGQIGSAAVPAILLAIEKENPDAITREHWSVKCLQTIGGEALTPLSTALKNSKVSIRLVAARGLGEMGPVAAPAMSALLAAAGDADPRVRAAILSAVVGTRAQTGTAVARVEAGLKDASPIVRIAAAQLVPQLGDQAATLAPALLPALTDRDPAMRAAVVQALTAVGPAAEPAVASLLQLLPKADIETRARILIVFAAIGPAAKAALPEARNLVKDPEPAVRAAALTAFAKLEDPKERLPILLAALGDPALPVRKSAAKELGGLADKARDATGPLVAMLQHEDERDAAFEALRQILPKSVPHLIQMLGDRDLAVKQFAIKRLSSLGPEAHEAVPALQAILSGNERSELKKTSTEALKRIKP